MSTKIAVDSVRASQLSEMFAKRQDLRSQIADLSYRAREVEQDVAEWCLANGRADLVKVDWHRVYHAVNPR